MRLIGRFFKGVVASGTLPPDAAQDVTNVNADHGRIIVADGAGDTGASAGDWAQVLSLCYAASREDASTREPEWLRRAVEVWRTTSHVAQLAADGHNLSRGERRLVREGVAASFVAATFSEKPNLTMHWIAAGDCEVMLFRDGRLIEWEPVPTWKDFSSFANGVSSNGETATEYFFGEWAIQPSDTILFATDALACHVLRLCESMDPIPDSIKHLLSLRDWNDVRAWIEETRGEGEVVLENDDVGIVRVRVEEDLYASGPFTLRRERPSALQDIELRRGLLGMVMPVPRARREVIPQRQTAELSPSAIKSSSFEAPPPFLYPEVDPPPTAVVRTPAVSPPARRFDWTAFAAGTIAGVLFVAVVFSVTEATFGRPPRVASSIAPVQSATIVPTPAKKVGPAEPNDVPPPPAIAKEPPATASLKPKLATGAVAQPAHPIETTPLPAEPAATPAVASVTVEPSAEDAPAGPLDTSAAALEQPLVAVTPAAEAESGERDAERDGAVTKPEQENGTDCVVPKNAKLFAHGDRRRKTPLLIVEADALPCRAGPGGTGPMVIFTAWVRLPGNSAPEALRWVAKRKLPDAMNVWIAPGRPFLGNLKAGTVFTSNDRQTTDEHLWIELLVSADR